MAEVKWIKLETGLPCNKKIKQLRKLPDGDSIALMWVFLMCLAGDTNEDGLIYFTKEVPYTDEMLADQFDMEINTVRLGLATFQKFGMIEIVEDIICLPSWEKWQSTDRLSEIREYNRLAKQKSRAKQKQALLENVNDKSMTSQRCHDTDKDIDIDIDKEKKNSANKPLKSDIDSFFDSIWDLYPNKKGKGQVSDAKKKKLFDIGYEEVKRAIDRYKADLKKDADWRKPQNGSTFFNSGYVDYLDANYTQVSQGGSPSDDMTDLDDLF